MDKSTLNIFLINVDFITDFLTNQMNYVIV